MTTCGPTTGERSVPWSTSKTNSTDRTMTFMLPLPQIEISFDDDDVEDEEWKTASTRDSQLSNADVGAGSQSENAPDDDDETDEEWKTASTRVSQLSEAAIGAGDCERIIMEHNTAMSDTQKLATPVNDDIEPDEEWKTAYTCSNQPSEPDVGTGDRERIVMEHNAAKSDNQKFGTEQFPIGLDSTPAKQGNDGFEPDEDWKAGLRQTIVDEGLAFLIIEAKESHDNKLREDYVGAEDRERLSAEWKAGLKKKIQVLKQEQQTIMDRIIIQQGGTGSIQPGSSRVTESPAEDIPLPWPRGARTMLVIPNYDLPPLPPQLTAQDSRAKRVDRERERATRHVVPQPLVGRRGCETHCTSPDRDEHLHSFRGAAVYTTAHERQCHPDTWVTSEALYKRPRPPTLETQFNAVEKWDPSSPSSATRTPVRKLWQRSKSEQHTAHSPQNLISTIWKSSLPPEDTTASTPFILNRRSSTASMRSIGSAAGVRLSERDNNDDMPGGGMERGRGQANKIKGRWTSLKKAKEKTFDIRHSARRSYSAPSERDEKHAGSTSESPERTLPVPYSSSSSTARAIVSVPSFNDGSEEEEARKEEEWMEDVELYDEARALETMEKEQLKLEEALTEKGKRRETRFRWEQTRAQADDVRIREARRRRNEAVERGRDFLGELKKEDEKLEHQRQSIQECLCQLDKMDLSRSRILLLEEIHEKMWSDLPTILFIRWNDLPWPAFVRPTCLEDLMLHRTVSYLFQVSKTIDIKEVLGDRRRVQWAQERLQILLGNWARVGLQSNLEDSADKNIIQGVRIVTKHLEDLLQIVKSGRIDDLHHKVLTTIISRTFLDQVGKNLAQILTNMLDNSGYRSLLRLEGNSAQQMLNFLHALLDQSGLVSLPKNDILGALLRLTKKTKLYPECLTLRDLERGNIVLAESGRFGEIYKGRCRNQDICFKIFKINKRTNLLKALSKEALLWGHLSHPNVLPFYGIYHLEDTRGRICLVSPWMENGNITAYLKGHPLANRLLLVWDIIQGIQFLHENKVVHGDLKGLNVLVKRNGRGCLADFGLANLVDEDILRWTSIQTTVHQNAGTVRWEAPELIDPPSDESVKATPASDIYAFACVCYEIYTGHVPFHKIARDITVMKKVVDGSRPPRPVDTTLLSDEIWQVIEMCWNQEPQDRPTAEMVIERLPLAGVLDDRPSGDDFLTPSDFRAAAPENSGIIFNPAVDIILSSVLRSTPALTGDLFT